MNELEKLGVSYFTKLRGKTLPTPTLSLDLLAAEAPLLTVRSLFFIFTATYLVGAITSGSGFIFVIISPVSAVCSVVVVVLLKSGTIVSFC